MTIAKKPVAAKKAPSAGVQAMAAARAAKKSAGGKAPAKKTAAKAKPGVILFKAPTDFKPAFFEVEFETLRDGLVRGGSVSIQRVRGRWDNADAKRFDLSTYDLPTLIGVATRIGAAAMAPNVLKRLPPKTKFGLILRVAKRSANDSLTAGVKAVKRLGVGKGDKPKWFWISNQSEGADLITYRKLRKMTRVLPGAFVEVQLPPSGRGKKAEESE